MHEITTVHVALNNYTTRPDDITIQGHHPLTNGRTFATAVYKCFGTVVRANIEIGNHIT